jgi:hypothetical protein
MPLSGSTKISNSQSETTRDSKQFDDWLKKKTLGWIWKSRKVEQGSDDVTSSESR